MGHINNNIDKYVPKTKGKSPHNRNVPWWNSELKREIKKKQRTWKTYTQARTHESYMIYKAQRNRTTQKLREARRNYENMLANGAKREPRKLSKYIRGQLKVRAKVGSLAREDGTLTESDKEAADILHNFCVCERGRRTNARFS